jgi:membrane protease YdiL (CAAX protease family)
VILGWDPEHLPADWQAARGRWILAGFVVLYGTLAGLAEIDATGRLGLPILAGVLLVAVFVERVLHGTPIGAAVAALGFGRPAARAVVVALAISVPVVVLPSLLIGVVPALRPGWPWLLLGIFAFHGLAEEVVWRGYAYRRLREGRSFGRAVVLTMPLVVAAHVPVVFGSGPAVGGAAMLVAAATTVPFAHLVDMGRGTIWAPALLHTAIDTFKLATIPAGATLTFSLTLATVSVVIPLLVLAVPRAGRPATPSPWPPPRLAPPTNGPVVG